VEPLRAGLSARPSGNRQRALVSPRLICATGGPSFVRPAMSAINRFLLENNLRITTNPCVSPDFCLDWPALRAALVAGERLRTYPRSFFHTKAGSWTLLENAQGDCA